MSMINTPLDVVESMNPTDLLIYCKTLREEAATAAATASITNQTLKKQALEVVKRCKHLEVALQEERDASTRKSAVAEGTEENRSRVKDLEARVTAFDAERVRLLSDFEHVRLKSEVELQAAKAQTDATEEVLRVTQSQLDNFIATNADLERQVTDLQNELSSMRAHGVHAGHPSSETASDISSLKAELASKHEEVTAACLEVTQLRAQLLQEQQNRPKLDPDLELDFARLAQKNLTLLSEVADLSTAREQLEKRVASLATSVEERDCQLVASADSVLALRAECDQLHARVKKLGQESDMAEGHRAPREAQVLLRVRDESENKGTGTRDGSCCWCLVRVRGSIQEGSEVIAELDWRVLWVPEPTVHRWNELRTRHFQMSSKNMRSEKSTTLPATTSFSIDHEHEADESSNSTCVDIVLPGVAQDMASAATAALERSLSALRAEQAQSQAAFETYRERSRASLVETLEKLKHAEATVQGAKDEATAAARAGAERERQLRATLSAVTDEKELMFIAYEKTVTGLNEQLSAERLSLTETKQAMVALQRELQANVDGAELRALEQRQRDEKILVSQESAGVQLAASSQIVEDLESRLRTQEEALAAAAQNERKLLSDMKKKGDVARQLVAAQEKEIESLRGKLQGALAATVPVPPATKASSAVSSVRFAVPISASAPGMSLTLPSEASEPSALKSGMLAHRSVDDSATAASEREQYLRQAFYALFKAEAGQDMQHMCRAICAILQLSPHQCREISAKVDILAAAVAQHNTLSSISSNLSGVGSSIGSGLSSLTSLWS